MRGDDIRQDSLFSYISPEVRVLKRHPLRVIRRMVGRVLADLNDEFEAIYSWAI